MLGSYKLENSKFASLYGIAVCEPIIKAKYPLLGSFNYLIQLNNLL